MSLEVVETLKEVHISHPHTQNNNAQTPSEDSAGPRMQSAAPKQWQQPMKSHGWQWKP